MLPLAIPLLFLQPPLVSSCRRTPQPLFIGPLRTSGGAGAGGPSGAAAAAAAALDGLEALRRAQRALLSSTLKWLAAAAAALGRHAGLLLGAPLARLLEPNTPFDQAVGVAPCSSPMTTTPCNCLPDPGFFCAARAMRLPVRHVVMRAHPVLC